MHRACANVHTVNALLLLSLFLSPCSLTRPLLAFVCRARQSYPLDGLPAPVPGITYCLPPNPPDAVLFVLLSNGTGASPSSLRVVFYEPARPSIVPLLNVTVDIQCLLGSFVLSTSTITISYRSVGNATAAERTALANQVRHRGHTKGARRWNRSCRC